MSMRPHPWFSTLLGVAIVAVGCNEVPPSVVADVGAERAVTDDGPAPADTPGELAARSDAPEADVALEDVAREAAARDATLDAEPEAGAPDDASPDLPSDAQAPDAPLPDALAIDAPPDVVAPDVAAPDATAPDAAAPDVAAPDVAPPAAPPRITSLSPASAIAGDTGFFLTIRGTGFVPGSRVTWGAAARSATFLSATSLRIHVEPADVASAGTTPVVVTNPTPGGGSASEGFVVQGSLTSRTWLTASTFRTAAGWFNSTSQERVWLADVDGDRIDDLLGLDDEGAAWMSRGTGTSFATTVRLASATTFRTAVDWFATTTRQRVWATDVTGDGRADLLGVDTDGGVWVSESSGSAFAATRRVAMTTFSTAAGYFANGDQPHVFLADMNADGKTDIVGVHPATGRVGVALATGSGAVASFAAEAAFLTSSVFNTPAEWFLTTRAPRVFLGDITGDRRADFVGLAVNGDLYVAEATAAGMNPPRRVGSTVFSDANGWFAAPTQPRVALADFNGDGKLDVLGVGAPAVGDGDIWALESIGSGSTADVVPRVLLHESAFRSANGWFAGAARPSVWFTDVTGDGRADVLGVDTMGGVWVARSITDASSPGVTPAGRHDFLLPAVRNGDSGLSAAHFSPSLPRRVWVGDVTGDGARDLVAIDGAGAADGDVRWRMAAPTMVQSIGPVSRRMLTSGSPQPIEVALSRRPAAASLDVGALEVALDGVRIVPSAVNVTARGAVFTVTFPSTVGPDASLHLALAARATDAWSQGIDGDGDGRVGGGAARPARWSPSLVAGASRVSLMPPDATGIPRRSGFDYCPNIDLPVTSSTLPNPTEARVVVIAGGGACAAGAPCAAGQSCVAGQCQGAGDVDANLPLVLVSLDLIGVNPGRLSELLARRYGIPKHNVILSATHTHAAFRSIRLFDAPYFDERSAGAQQYETWLEDRVADGVGEALADMTPVEFATAAAQTTDVNINRRFVAPPSAEARTVTAVALRTPGPAPRARALLVNYAMHPVVEGGGGGVSADYPGYLRQELEALRCAPGDEGCAVLFLQAGAGDINYAPDSLGGFGGAAAAQVLGRALARTVAGMSLTFRGSELAQVQVQRRITSFGGTSACNSCERLSARAQASVVWDARATAVSIGVPGSPALLRFGTLPGEAFSGLQEALVAGLTPAPILLGYANGYLGYLPTRGIIGDGAREFTRYGVVVCDGPTFFASSAAAPTIGDTMVAGLRAALTNDLR